MSRPEVITLGCRLNAFESEVIRQNLSESASRDLVVINTCAVTGEATRQARQEIRRAHRRRPNARILVTGCAAQIDPDTFSAMPEVSMVLGNREKLESATFKRLGQLDRVTVADIMENEKAQAPVLRGFEGRSRAFVQVQNGCDHRCTFCIIPFGRGNSRSLTIGAVVDQCRELVGAGFREIVLTGVDLTSYGGDLDGRPPLGRLVVSILEEVPELPRLRLSSLDPAAIDDELFDVITGDKRLMPHVHLSVQSGDNMILKRMKRRHTRGDVIDLTGRLRTARPEIAFGADLIAGFPTETEAMFANSLDLISECDLTFLHVFPYSEREGTSAARMPAVEKPVRRKRARRLRKAGQDRLRHHLQGLVGNPVRVLVERDKDGWLSGHGETFANMRFRGAAEIGSIAKVTASAYDESGLIGGEAA